MTFRFGHHAQQRHECQGAVAELHHCQARVRWWHVRVHQGGGRHSPLRLCTRPSAIVHTVSAPTWVWPAHAHHALLNPASRSPDARIRATQARSSSARRCPDWPAAMRSLHVTAPHPPLKLPNHVTCVATPAVSAVTQARETAGSALHMAGARAASTIDPTLRV